MDWLFGSQQPRFDPNKLKVNLKLAQSRMNLQKNKNNAQLKIDKKEIANMLIAGKTSAAQIKVESVIRTQYTNECYEVLELFCELIGTRIPVMAATKDLIPDMHQAICTLMWAALRLPVKELQIARQELANKYGKELVEEAANNCNNCVHPGVFAKLTMTPLTADTIHGTLEEIASEAGISYE